MKRVIILIIMVMFGALVGTGICELTFAVF